MRSLLRQLLNKLSRGTYRGTSPSLFLGRNQLQVNRQLASMRAIVADNPGVISVVERPIPEPNESEELIKVMAVGVNRADLLQLNGKYPPPDGVTDILGLEASGFLSTGELVSVLLKGGGFAEYAIAPKSCILRFPPGTASLSAVQLAAIPEAFLAAYHVMFQIGELKENETVLINAAASGVGTSAIQLGLATRGVKIISCVGSTEKANFCRELGAHHTINYREENISDRVKELTENKGVDLVLDCVGADQFKANEKSLRKDGRWVIYGLLSGAKHPDIGLGRLVTKRLTLKGTTLRSRSNEYRGELVSEFVRRFGHQFADGLLRPIIHDEFSGLECVSDAFQCLASNRTIGKLVVRI